MVIDIVDLSSEKYQNLNAVQLSMVRAAQTKKDKILAEAEEEKQKVRLILLANNVARSSMLVRREAEIAEKAEGEITALKEDLDYQIAYEAIGSEGNEQGPYRYPENPNYNLSYSQRFLTVRSYYMGVTSDAEARLQAYTMDSLARTYLGEFYQTLYDLLASYV